MTVIKNDPEEEEEDDVAVGDGNDTAIPDKEVRSAVEVHLTVSGVLCVYLKGYLASQQTGRIKREPLSVVSKLELSKGDAEGKTGEVKPSELLLLPCSMDTHCTYCRIDMHYKCRHFCISVPDIMDELGLGDVDDLEGNKQTILT